MQRILIDNYLIETPISKIIELLRISLTNGKLKDVQDKSDDIVVSCPFHSGGQEEHGSCFIRKKDGVFHCFGCGEKGSFLKFVAECFDAPESYAKAWLLKNFGGELVAKNLFMGEPIVLNRNKGIKKQLDESILDQYQTWNPYFNQRKLTRETAQKFNLRYDPKYRQVIFPYYNEKGQLITLLKRSIDTKTFFIETGSTKPVYGINKIFQDNIRTCVLTEGLFDCLLANQYGMPTIATLGNPSIEQFELINKSPLSTIYLMFDNDNAGRSFNEKAHKYLSKRLFIIDVNIIGKKDIGELSYDEFWKFINIAKKTF